ncbi:UNVERIFIED_CONTAM: hypothetical protein Scaly_0388600 [Sesamum calycinum]|uniref:Uncharacterized protein n=1 Tax=Sesamum calycinum TaxID=2727403 RepID=A0AAW2SE61_9LAMI
MAASANPSSGAHSNASNGNNNSGNSKGGGQENANGGGGLSATENSVVGPTQARSPAQSWPNQLWHLAEIIGVRMGLEFPLWSCITMLKVVLMMDTGYASETVVVRYAKIAQALRDKTVRDVALRCRWMSKKENGKRRKDDSSSSRKSKDKKEKVTDSLPKSSQVANRSNGPTYVQSMMSMDSDDGISYKDIGGAAGQLLEQSAHALDQISANFSACKAAAEMLYLLLFLCQIFRVSCELEDLLYLQNLVKHSVVIDLNDMPEIMKQMPPLPVKLNEELANSILPRTSLPKKS